MDVKCMLKHHFPSHCRRQGHSVQQTSICSSAALALRLTQTWTRDPKRLVNDHSVQWKSSPMLHSAKLMEQHQLLVSTPLLTLASSICWQKPGLAQLFLWFRVPGWQQVSHLAVASRTISPFIMVCCFLFLPVWFCRACFPNSALTPIVGWWTVYVLPPVNPLTDYFSK